MSLPVVSMKDVSIGYPGTEPFKHISFEIKKNECWALMGDNDSLITAMLDAIAGKAIVSKGKLEFNFYDEISVTEKKSPFHLVALLSSGQNFQNLSGVDESYYQQRYNSQDSENSLTLGKYLISLYQNKSETIWTLERIIETLHLETLLEEHLIKLSTGETKRVRIAEALSRNPKILLLNHLFTGLDAQSRKEIMHFIDAISATGITIVMHTKAGEIPDCITHVAHISAEDKIHTFPKKDFKVNGRETSKPLNRELLQTLLSINTLPQFDTIVGMKNVSIKYDGHLILDSINWEIKQGERWALSGPNGSGKTTLLSLINGDNPQAFANDIILFDRKKGSGESIWDIKKKIGFFSTELYQYFPLDTQCVHAIESGFFDTVGLFRPSHSFTVSIALQWMELFGIAHLSQKLLRNVSANERRICLLMRALVKNPVLLILDEPGQGLGEEEKRFFKELIENICEMRNVTLIYVSHYQDEIPNNITRFIHLESGKRVNP